jgi:hypothetical protein
MFVTSLFHPNPFRPFPSPQESAFLPFFIHISHEKRKEKRKEKKRKEKKRKEKKQKTSST